MLNSTIPQSPDQVKPLGVGNKIPRIFLRSSANTLFDVNRTLRDKPALLIFFRGGWCPYCNMKMSALRHIEQDLYALGYNIFGVTPDRPQKIKESEERHAMQYTILSDSKMQVTKAFGLAYQLSEDQVAAMKRTNFDVEDHSGETHHLLPVPAVYLVNSREITGFQYVNPDYTARIDEKRLLKEARSAIQR